MASISCKRLILPLRLSSASSQPIYIPRCLLTYRNLSQRLQLSHPPRSNPTPPSNAFLPPFQTRKLLHSPPPLHSAPPPNSKRHARKLLAFSLTLQTPPPTTLPHHAPLLTPSAHPKPHQRLLYLHRLRHRNPHHRRLPPPKHRLHPRLVITTPVPPSSRSPCLIYEAFFAWPALF